MVNRARQATETYDEYRKRLRDEHRARKDYLSGHFVTKSKEGKEVYSAQSVRELQRQRRIELNKQQRKALLAGLTKAKQKGAA